MGVYEPEDPGAPNDGARQGRIGFNFGEAFTKGISLATGQCPVKKYNRYLRDLIIHDRANPATIISHELPLDDAPDAYNHFDKRDDGWTKVVLHPTAA